MSIPVIQKTSDYSIFKMVGFNRDKKKNHVENLKKIIQKENLLHLHPILINNQQEVIDGQHRLQAAKELGIPVFYIQSDLSYDHILNSNLMQKKISFSDVIKFYALKDKLPDYEKLRDYLYSLGINPKALLGLLFGSFSRPLIEMIKSGKFVFPSNTSAFNHLVASYAKFKEFAQDKRITPTSIYTHTDFMIAFRNVVTLAGYNENVFFSKLEQRWFDLKPQLNSKEWTKNLIGIYNWKNHNPIQINDENS